MPLGRLLAGQALVAVVAWLTPGPEAHGGAASEADGVPCAFALVPPLVAVTSAELLRLRQACVHCEKGPGWHMASPASCLPPPGSSLLGSGAAFRMPSPRGTALESAARARPAAGASGVSSPAHCPGHKSQARQGQGGGRGPTATGAVPEPLTPDMFCGFATRRRKPSRPDMWQLLRLPLWFFAGSSLSLATQVALGAGSRGPLISLPLRG